MSQEIKKPLEVTAVTTVASADYIDLTLSNGTRARISVSNLKASLLAGISVESMMDGIFIMCHRKSNNNPTMYKPESWPAMQAAGEVADGVVVVEGGKLLVVAPTESPTGMSWSSAPILGGGITTGDRAVAYNDWAGKANTAAQIAASTAGAVTNTASYAPGYCNLYSRVNANGQGLTAGKWWQPSLGELMMMYANFNKINYALSLITGADLLRNTGYWSSTETNISGAWIMSITNGVLISPDTKATMTYRVRAVSAFIA